MGRTADQERREIRRSVSVSAAADKVFAMVSEPDGMSNWFCQRAHKTDYGFYAEWDLVDAVNGVACKIVETEEPNTFSFLFGWEEKQPDVNTLVTFTVEPDGDNCVFSVRESGFGQGRIADQAIEEHAHGWNLFLVRLAEHW